MLPDDIWNLTASILLVVFPYPATNTLELKSDASAVFPLVIKFLTNVVDDGLNKCKVPTAHWSLSEPTPELTF